ncbi:histidine kinase [Microscilla marina]|nr:histidine kinase [Microscilla marina]
MSYFRIRIFKWHWRYVGMLAMSLLIPLAIELAPQNVTHYPQNVLFSFLFSIVIWEGDQAIVQMFRQRYAKIQQTQIRTIATIGSTVLYTCTVIFIGLRVITWSYGIAFSLVPVGTIMAVAALLTLVLGAIYESRYFFGMWKATLLEAEHLKGEKVVSEFELLKQQVNPEFLFDSLHLLEALIEESEDEALDFTEKLSQTYRYILQHKDEELVDLHTEVAFVKQYLFLLQHQLTRPVEIDWQIAPAMEHRQIIPFAIQYILLPILTAARQNSLPQIQVTTTPHARLLLTIQGKHLTFDAIEVLLLPLQQKYAYLSNLSLKTEKANDYMKVYLPLLEAVSIG